MEPPTAGLVKVYNEWDPLEEIIVGTARGARIPQPNVDLQVLEYPESGPAGIPSGPFDPRVVEETEEDLALLVETLEGLEISVRRPRAADHGAILSTPDWSTDGFYNYCPRDILLAVGDTVIETPSPLRSRLLEAHAYQHILVEYMKSGSRWVAAPRPRLLDGLYRPGSKANVRLGNDEPAFDAANVLRVGRDLLYLISSTGNELGALWLQSTLGAEFRVHCCRDLYVNTHIDSTLTLLRPGLVLANAERVRSGNLPEILKSWEVMWLDDIVDVGYTGFPYATKWIGMNLLVINPELVIADARQRPLIRLLEARGIDVIPLQLRHARTLGGSFHCVTLDVRRRGELMSYV